MRHDTTSPLHLDPTTDLWRRPGIRAALRARDIGTVYRLLQRSGVSQRRIAALTGQSQSEVSEILSGRRVTSYDVLARIADGLGVPRGLMGLAYRAEETDAGTPLPRRVSVVHAQQITATTEMLRVVEADFGGGACRDAALAHLRHCDRLRGAAGPDTARRMLRTASAELRLLVGWASFDTGLPSDARRHFTVARSLAEAGGEPALVAKAEYCLGRVALHHGDATAAIRHLGAGLAVAERSGCPLTVVSLSANLAWAHAVCGERAAALRLLDRATDGFAAADPARAVRWSRHFSGAELAALTGMTHLALGDLGPRHHHEAIRALTTGLTLRGPGQARSRVFELTALATAHLTAGDPEVGLGYAARAVDLAEIVQSVRVADRLTPLRDRLTGLAAGTDLLHRLCRLQDQASDTRRLRAGASDTGRPVPAPVPPTHRNGPPG